VRPESSRPTPPGLERVAARLAADELVAFCGSADLVVHLAGLTKARSLDEFCRANVDGTREVAEAARRFGARLVHVSSQAVAGPAALQTPSLENDSPRPITSYAVSKRLAEDAVRGMAELRWTILRPSAVYGPGDRAFLPVFRLARAGLFPIVGNPGASYTLVHVDDVARSIALAAGSDAALREVMFIGHPSPVSVGGLMAELARVFGRRYRPRRIPAALIWIAAGFGEGLSRGGWPQNLDRSRWKELRAAGFVCSVEKARQVLGFEAEVGLRDGLAGTAEWYAGCGWLGRLPRRA
jgi:nucleoside-diphosphate-sugar epimerase